MKTNVLDGPGRPRPVSGDKFKVGSIHQGTVGKYFFGKRVWDNNPLGVFVDFGGPRPGIIFDHGSLGLMTGETIGIKIVKIEGIGRGDKIDLEFVNRVPGSEAKVEPTDIGSFIIIPRCIYPPPEGFTGDQLDALAPKELAKFSITGPEKDRDLIEEGVIVTCSLNQKQYRFLAQKCIWETVVALAKGEKVNVRIGKYCLGTMGGHYIHHPSIPGYALAVANIPCYENVNDGEERFVYLKDHPKYSLMEVAKQLGEGALTLSIVPKPMKGIIIPSERFSTPNFRVKVPYKFEGKEYWHPYFLPEYFGQMYKVGDEVEIVLVGEQGRHPDQVIFCCPVRELKQLEQMVESLRQGTEIKIRKIDCRLTSLVGATIEVDGFTLSAKIFQRDQADKSLESLAEGQPVRLALARQYKEMSFPGNELFWMSHFNKYSSNSFELTVAD